MIKVLSLTIYKEGESERLMYEAFRDKEFRDNKHLEQWRVKMQNDYSEAFNFEVKAYVIRRAKPEKEIDMMQILINTAHVMGQDMKLVESKVRKREVVDVRKAACMILFDLDYNPLDIEKNLPFKNRTVYSYRTKMEDRFLTERGFEEKYNEIKKRVMDMTLKPIKS